MTLARRWDLPVVASVHTRFETYPRYYGMAFLEPVVLAILRRFYRRCDAIFAPSDSMAQLLRDQRMNYDVGIWTRGIDREIFNPGRRDLAWRRALGIDDDVPVIGFVGRLVMEKGLDVFSDTIDRLTRRQVRHKVLVVGDGPARDWFEKRLPDAIFAGFQGGPDLGRAVASMDMLFNPSVTETFGNVTLEAMAGRHAGGRGERDRQPEPGHRRRHRPADPPRRDRPLLRGARSLLPRRGGARRRPGKAGCEAASATAGTRSTRSWSTPISASSASTMAAGRGRARSLGLTISRHRGAAPRKAVGSRASASPCVTLTFQVQPRPARWLGPGC